MTVTIEYCVPCGHLDARSGSSASCCAATDGTCTP